MYQFVLTFPSYIESALSLRSVTIKSNISSLSSSFYKNL